MHEIISANLYEIGFPSEKIFAILYTIGQIDRSKASVTNPLELLSPLIRIIMRRTIKRMRMNMISESMIVNRIFSAIPRSARIER